MESEEDPTTLEDSEEWTYRHPPGRRPLGLIGRVRTKNFRKWMDVSPFPRSFFPIVQIFSDGTRTVDDEPSDRRLFRRYSLPGTSSETHPLISGDVPKDDNKEDPIIEQVEDKISCCAGVINCYKNSVIMFRDSVFMYLVQVLFYSIPVSAIVMGVLFADKCPKVQFLPIYGAVLGSLGALLMLIWIAISCISGRGMPYSKCQRIMLACYSLVVLLLTIVDAVLVFCLSPKSDPASKEYCNETFYDYAFYKQIASAVVLVLTLIIYIPGSRHCFCCHECSISSPNFFYESL